MFRSECPERFPAQAAIVKATDPRWAIADTVFTTLTVNQYYETTYHRDIGDYKPGLGVLSVLRSGEYPGGLLVFLGLDVAVDIGSRDVLLCDVHEVHGKTRLIGKKGTFTRLSTVLYYKENIWRCVD